ncbi:MAG: AIM24 family protein [Clostridium sp.]|uniref:AIM24 family protein n=1 Tax=Clostridium TaxID=1485 RepID=UPI0021538808|nr:AIM24 family protein [Clostridium sp. LY3-2]MCR6514731.1 AIM24 family protein [Clostridium sp. LY3-2]
MRTSLNISNSLNLIGEMTNDSRFQVLEFDELRGATDVDTAFDLNVLNRGGVRLKQVRVLLEDSAVRIEAGLLSYMKGDIEISNNAGGVLGLSKKFIKSKLTGEEMFKPRYHGHGEIYLEPTFNHYALVELEDDEIIVDDRLFVACEDTVEVKVTSQKTISSALFGNEGFFQTKIKGEGIVVLQIPVPEEEIFKCRINEDVLKVDGSFAILRTGDIEFTVEKSATSIFGSATSKEGLLNVYRGTGEVWLIPTKSVYDKMKTMRIKEDISDLDLDNDKN